MDFARKQLEKYGWIDGKGLGKHGNGISEPLKPKLKRSTTGVGYDAAADFTEHWWSTLYNKAASNIEVENENGKTKKIRKRSEDKIEITNSIWKLNKKKKVSNTEEEYSEFFVRTEVLGEGGGKTVKVKDSDSETESSGDAKDVPKLTDEELFAACEGRTAHKGARHGLRALGKLARIARQEELLLQQEKYSGYSSCNNVKNSPILNIEEETGDRKCDLEKNIIKKKKKKSKHDSDNLRGSVEKEKVQEIVSNVNGELNVTNLGSKIEIKDSLEKEKTKKHKKKNENFENSEITTENLSKKKKKKSS